MRLTSTLVTNRLDAFSFRTNPAKKTAKRAYAVDNDTFAKQIGCVLFQNKPHVQVKPIGYWLGFLTEAERAYDTGD